MVVLGARGLSASSPEVRSMHPLQLHLEAESVRASEDRFAKMLGRHLGSMLDLDTLEALFFPPIPKPGEGTEEGAAPSKYVFSPLVLAIRPEMTEKLKEQARALLQMRDDKVPKPEVSPAVFDLDEAALEMLKAVSRAADAQKSKDDAEGPKWDPESDRRMGIQGHEVR